MSRKSKKQQTVWLTSEAHSLLKDHCNRHGLKMADYVVNLILKDLKK